MTTYVFVTDGNVYPADDLELNEEFEWSCRKSSKVGERALVYINGRGIQYEWEIASDARRDPGWGYVCDVVFVGAFDPPIAIKELKEHFSRDRWGAPHNNFRGMQAVGISEEVADEIRALREANQ